EKPEENLKSSYSFEKDWDAKKDQDLDINTEARHLQKYIETTLKIYPKVEPFDEKMKNYEWWQIQYNTQTIYRAYMPFIAYVEMMQNPHYYHNAYYYTSEYHKQLYMYQHHIFGVCYDEKRRARYYVYGVPGRRTSMEQPYRGKSGFVYWRPSHYKPFNQEGFGYWLMHVDPNTGGVIQPLEPTKL
ncbi:MAG: hypothetical protein JJT76_12335, partial [Clostridiaceae bacterium]|nr:hypothetical protein [Clostridiaceae bacterium]